MGGDMHLQSDTFDQATDESKDMNNQFFDREHPPIDDVKMFRSTVISSQETK